MPLDPLTALSVAGTIIQFVDFGTKLVSRTKELYQDEDGVLGVNKELEDITRDLLKLSVKLRRPVEVEDTSGEESSSGKELAALAIGCSHVAEDMIKHLDKLKVDGPGGKSRKWKSFGAALKAAWSRRELLALHERLVDFQNAIQTRTLIGLKEDIDVTAVQTSERFAKLDFQTRHIITALMEERNRSAKSSRRIETSVNRAFTEQIRAIAEMLNHIEVVVLNNAKTMIIDAFEQTKDRNIMNIASRGVFREHNSELQEVCRAEEQLRLSIETRVLEQLEFSTMTDRLQEVDDAHAKTCEWIFKDTWGRETPWDNFVDWLQSREGNGIYWVNGKAGSGKSTLMRYIFTDRRTQTALRIWAKPLKPTTAAFFFWNSGTVEQQNQIGLLRALLFEVLHQHRALIPVILPWLWAKEYTTMSSESKTLGPLEGKLDRPREKWALPKLKAAFRNLVNQTSVPVKLCFFIDGLDEYNGDHEDVTELFRGIASCPNIKVCVSSRPLLVFDDAFKSCPHLRLQDLSYEDIKQYVGDKLGKNERYRQLLAKEPKQAPAIVEEVVTKADGVFLWVRLVVRSLLAGLGNRDDIRDLQRRLRLIPADLESLYQQMLLLIDPFYLEHASQLFQLLRAASEDPVGPLNEPTASLTVLGLAYADEEGYDNAINGPICLLSEEEVSSICQLMADRLKSRCAGLLETRDTETSLISSGRRTVHKVQYLHRTVKDYLHQPDTWTRLLEYTSGTSFKPHAALLKSCILQLKQLTHDDTFQYLWPLASTAMAQARNSDTSDIPMEPLLDQLDEAMMFHGNKSTMGMKGHWSEHNQPMWSNTFLSLAIQYNLRTYVALKLSKDSTLIAAKEGRPLLDYAVNPVNQSIGEIRPAMVAILLQHGANPNEMVGRTSIWEIFLTRLCRQRNKSRASADDVSIFEQLLSCKANMSATCSCGIHSRPPSPWDIMDNVIKRPEEPAAKPNGLAQYLSPWKLYEYTLSYWGLT